MVDRAGAAGSNTDKNAELTSEVRMGRARVRAKGSEGGVCSACLGAGVSRAFLLSNRHARKGPKICPAITQKWQQKVGRPSSAVEDSSANDGSSTD